MKLLFGLRTSAAVDFSVTTQSQLSSPPPSLRIKTSAQETAISCNNNTWATTLSPGDYIVYLPTSGGSWFDGSISFTFSVPVMIVGLNSNQVPQAWSDATGTVGASPYDAKNPLPPPTVNLVTAPPCDATWLTTLLVQMNPSPARSADIDWSASASQPGVADPQ